jgi:periplasmic divalent cation tolerance protein
MILYRAAMAEHLLVYCTCPDKNVARDIAEQLVQQQLAACINIVPGLESVYRWKNNIEHGTEVLLLIKTMRHTYSDLEKTLRGMHPYELPEIIAVPIEAGDTQYLQWIETNCKQ